MKKRSSLRLATDATEPEMAPIPLGQRLLEIGKITPDQLRIALHEQQRADERLGEILVRLNFLEEGEMLAALVRHTGMERVDLSRLRPSPDCAARLSPATAKRCRVLPLDMQDGTLSLAMADPQDLRTLDEVRRLYPEAEALRPLLASPTEIAAFWETGAALETAVRDLDRDQAPEGDEHPIIALVDGILGEALRQNASDIHLEPEANMVRVRYRVDGILQQARALHRSHWNAIAQRVKLMGGLNIADSRSIQDGRFSYPFAGREVDCRLSILPSIAGENIVIRLLDKKQALLPLAELGFSPIAIERLFSVLEKPQGLTVVTGPTGSGKTTTLYSILRSLSTPEVSIATLEEPVEYQMDLVRQTPIAEAQGLGFAEAVRAVLRQDPDILFIGEIRDPETAQMAMRAAMTGHRVFATLHCGDALQAVPRLLDLGLSPQILAGNLAGLVAQRLVRKLCPACRVETTASEAEGRLLGIDPADNPSLFIPVGCARCGNTGRRGRTALAEVLPVSAALEDMILCNASGARLRRQAEAEGFVSLQADGRRRVLSGEIALEDLRRAVDLSRGHA